MPITCVVCKKFVITGSIRSFHKFPTDHDLKQKWMSIFGLSDVSKSATICSDHFDEKSFYQTDGYTRRKRLLPNAIPSIREETSSCTQRNALVNIHNDGSCDKDSLNNSVDPYPTLFICPMNESICEENKKCDDVHNGLVIPQNIKSENSYSQSTVWNESLYVYNKAGSEDNSSIGKHPLADTITEVPLKTIKLEQDLNVECNTMRIEFIDGGVIKYISREDCVSDEAWQRFLRFRICKELKNERK